MNKSKHTQLVNILFCLTAIVVLSACAGSEGSRGERGGGKDKRKGPPQEAIAACENRVEGDRISFSGRDGETINATCTIINNQLVAVPDGQKRR